jgi:hypothetical protein
MKMTKEDRVMRGEREAKAAQASDCEVPSASDEVDLSAD